MSPRVLFVSKPIAPPWNDGSKNLVRDVAENLTGALPTVLSTADAPALAAHVKVERVYQHAGGFAPGVSSNARVALRLLHGDALDIWHFVFAPNPLSSGVARAARRARKLGGWKGAVVQTVASAPKVFENLSRVLFGDVVVAQSEHTRARLLAAGASPSQLRVIPPCARAPRALSTEERDRARARLGFDGAKVVLYPGDYEVSAGARTVAEAVAAIVKAEPEARVVFACRKKTALASLSQQAVQSTCEALGVARYVTHFGEVSDMGELIAASDVVAFPVDDLYGKVDVPLVLLEAAALGVPMVVCNGGPLVELDGPLVVPPRNAPALAEAVVKLLGDESARRESVERAKKAYETRFSPPAVAAAYEAIYRELVS